MVAAPLVLAGSGLVGLVAGPALEPVLAPAASAITGRFEPLELSLWHGLGGARGAALLLSLAGAVAGALLYRRLARRPPGIEACWPALARVGPAALYDRGLAGLQGGAGRLAAGLQSGLLRRYLLVTVLAATAAIGAPLAFDLSRAVPAPGAQLRVFELLLVILTAAGAVFTAITRDRIAAIAALGVSGLTIAFLFALFSAPDLAITQLMVETLMVILLVLVFRRLPPAVSRWGPRRRATNAAAVAAVGAVVGTLILAAAGPAFPADAAAEFVATAPDQHSHNVVNAILVNFRALDTLGEILVLTVAGFGVHSLLRLGAGRPRP